MEETCPLPTVTAPAPAAGAAAVASGAVELEALRRFHFGDPAAPARPLPAELLPAALHRFRGVAVRGGWPLVTDPDGATERFGRPLGETLAAAAAGDRTLADNLPRLERQVAVALESGEPAPARGTLAAAAERVAADLGLSGAARQGFEAAVADLAAALPPAALLVPFGRRAPLELAALAARRRLARARAEFAVEAQELVAVADGLLEADRARRPETQSAAERVEQGGALAARFLDPTRLSGVVARRNAGAPFDAQRRARIEAARATLAAFGGQSTEPILILAASAADPCPRAALAFDAAAADIAVLARAARVIRLEAADAFDPARHLPGLERLDWRGFSRAELALVAPVVVDLGDANALAAELPSVTRMLLSGRPVQLLVTVGGDRHESEAGVFRLEPAYLGVAHREAFVHQGSLARPEALAAGFARALAGSRAALHVVDAPAFAVAGLDPWLVASARVTGRAAPLFRYDPEAGSSWARRLAFEENPEPAADWPREPLPESRPADAPAEAAFSFADAALLDPAWRARFAFAAAPSNELVPVADWLGLSSEEAGQHLPYVWAADARGALVRLVVDAVLAAATRDRLGFWRTLEELAGVRNEHVDAAVERARREAEERAAREREALEAKHVAALEKLRGEGDAAAIDRLVAALFEVEPQVSSAPPRAPRAAAGAGPAAAPAAAPPIAAVAVAAAPAAEAAEAWIDTALCTSCDECVRKSPGIFAYNGDKQAFVKNPRGGTFKDLVVAAEVCTAKIIHPGTPWNPGEPDLALLVERARRFA